MNTLSESQTDLIIKWVKSHHLTILSLENEFIDHICCDVESLMNEGKSFKAAFENQRRELGDEILPGLEKQTILQLTYNQRIMKLITRLAGIIVLLLFFTSIIFMFMEIEFWKNLMAGGMVILGLVFAPLFFNNHYNQQEVQGQKVLHIIGVMAAILVPLSAFLGLLNSPYALTVLWVGIIFLVMGFIPLSLLSVSKGPGRTALTGSIIFLLFFVLLSYGFLGIKISKDRLENWVFFSHSSERLVDELQRLNSDCILQLKNNSEVFELVSELENKSDKLVKKVLELRNGFIQEVSPGYKPGDLFFKGMDNNFAGKKSLIDNPATDMILQETREYEAWLISKLSEENEQVKQNITRILIEDSSGTQGDYLSVKNFLFRDFPVIADVSVLNCLIMNIRIAEYQMLKYLQGKNSLHN